MDIEEYKSTGRTAMTILYLLFGGAFGLFFALGSGAEDYLKSMSLTQKNFEIILLFSGGMIFAWEFFLGSLKQSIKLAFDWLLLSACLILYSEGLATGAVTVVAGYSGLIYALARLININQPHPLAGPLRHVEIALTKYRDNYKAKKAAKN